MSMLLCMLFFASFQVNAEEQKSEEIAERLEKASQLGLTEWVDENGYLTDSFYAGKSDSELSELEVDELVRSMSEEELDAYVARLNAGISLFMVTRYEKVSQINPYTGKYLHSGVFEVDGRLAFCIERSVATPPKGASTGDWVLVTNENIRKVLYYGYNGPADKGYTYLETAVAAAEANGDGDNSLGRNVLAEIKLYAVPPSNFKVWKVETNSGSTQDLAFYTIVEEGYAKVKKASGDEEITSGNENYSLGGAVYGIYTDAACTCEAGKVTTDVSGVSDTLSLTPGTYYMKEITAPAGYLLNESVKTFQVNAGETITVVMTDEPKTIVPDVLIQKVDAETGNTIPYENASFVGAKFLVKFYGGNYREDVNPAMLGVLPDKQWVMVSDADGVIRLNEEYFLDGDLLWTAFPLGTITIQEMESPEGYQINTEVFVQKLDAEDSGFQTVIVHEKRIEQKLPDTGNLWNMILIISGSIVCLGAIKQIGGKANEK